MLPLLTLALLSGPVHAEAPAPEYFDFASPDEWYQGYTQAESRFSELAPEWLRLEALAPLRGLGHDTLISARVGMEAELAQNTTDLQVARAHLVDVNKALGDERSNRALMVGAIENRKAAAKKQDDAVEEAAARLNKARLDTLTVLAALGKDGLRARGLLNTWWELRGRVDWDAVYSVNGTDQGVGRHDAAREDLEVACRLLPESGQASCTMLLAAAEDDLAARKARQDTRILLDTPTPQRLTVIDDQIRSLERELIETTSKIEQGEAKDEHLRDQLGQADAMLLEGEDQEVEVLKGVDTKLAELEALYGKLIRGLIDSAGRLEPEEWCAVYVHGGLVRVMRNDDGAVDLLRVAASSYEASCRSLMSNYTGVPRFQAAWAEANLLAAEAGRSYLVFPLGDGVWVLDGVPLSIGSATLVPVVASTHRVEFRPTQGAMASLFEDLHVDRREVVTWNADGELSLHDFPLGMVQPPEGFTPVVPPFVPQPEGFGPPGARGQDEKSRKTSLTLGMRYLHLVRRDVLDDEVVVGQRDLLGGSVALGRLVHSGKAFDLTLGLAQDAVFGDGAYAYTGSLIIPALLRERTWAELATHSGRVQGLGLISLGFIPPFQAAVGEVDLGVRVKLADGVGLRLDGGFSSTRWLGSLPDGGASAQLGVERWF